MKRKLVIKSEKLEVMMKSVIVGQRKGLVDSLLSELFFLLPM